MTIDIYIQYFSADLEFNGVPRHAAIVKLTSESEAGKIRYTASVSFFPHNSEDDYAVSYDAFFEEVLYNASGRRSKKREVALLKDLPSVIDRLASDAGGTVYWDQPLREARID